MARTAEMLVTMLSWKVYTCVCAAETGVLAAAGSPFGSLLRVPVQAGKNFCPAPHYIAAQSGLALLRADRERENGEKDGEDKKCFFFSLEEGWAMERETEVMGGRKQTCLLGSLLGSSILSSVL